MRKTRRCLSKICRSRHYGSRCFAKERSSSAHAGTCELALKRYKTNINAISPPLHRFYSARACGASINGAIKFHANFIGKPRYRRPSKRPPRKRDRRSRRANKTRIRRAVWLKFKRPRKNEAVKFSQNPLLKTAQIYRRPLASRGLKIYATPQKRLPSAGLICNQGKF